MAGTMSSIGSFRKSVWGHYKKHGRHDLPWRKTRDPYKVLVSEVMLQQTQVPRVKEKYAEFLKMFPTMWALEEASLADVLKVWSGLGYNRRAKYLRDAAIEIVREHGGKVPRGYDSLRALPGVGDYTAHAIRVFAFNKPDALIETNIRTVCMYHFFPRVPKIRDRAVLVRAQRAAEGQDPRRWHWALMDYGAYLKASGVRVNARSVHYTKQSRFEGSLRQLRGTILRELHAGSKSRESLRSNLKNSPRSDLEKFKRALAGLVHDRLIVSRKKKWQIA